LGVRLSKSKQEDIVSVSGQFDINPDSLAGKDASKEEVTKAIKELDAPNSEYAVNPGTKLPKTTFKKKVADLEAAVATKTKDVDETKSSTDSALVRLQNDKKALQGQLDQALKNLEDAKTAAKND